MSSQLQKVVIFWFRRDLRLEDNAGLYHALKSGLPVVPLFIFDQEILRDLKGKEDRRVQFIHQRLEEIKEQIRSKGSGLMVKSGKPVQIWQELLSNWVVSAVYTNEDYEPYARERDEQVRLLLEKRGISFYAYKDQVIFSRGEILKADGKPYTVYTPYKNRWLDSLTDVQLASFASQQRLTNFLPMSPLPLPALPEIGFQTQDTEYPSAEIDENVIREYHKTRDFPGLESGTSRMGIHLRFGTLSIRKLVAIARKLNPTYLSELIWREFFMMILYHFPRVIRGPFKEKYSGIKWLNNREHFQRWCEGQTGYPMVDAGMRELNSTGYMHNRVRMITASFLTKHLLIDWRWGEQYFAEKLLDFELAANNGNWQWAAGCGCDAAPYFRVFNPTTQIDKFDTKHTYIKKWVPEYQANSYPRPMVEHRYARERALEVYARAVKG